MSNIKPQRIRLLRDGEHRRGPVVYWMSRDQRIIDNWALLFARKLAMDDRVPLAVVFCLVPEFLGATLRHYDFMLKGLQEVESSLAAKQIPFILLTGQPSEEIPRFIRKHKAGYLITDFDPLRIKRRWQTQVAKAIDIPLYLIDTHNIVPCREVSDKQEYGAYTIRPKIHRKLDNFLDNFPRLKKQTIPWAGSADRPDWDRLYKSLKVDKDVQPVDWIEPGERAAAKALRGFITKRLARYHLDRNDPNINGQSGLSPYLHFGQISPQRVALAVIKADAPKEAKDAFLEELIIRRELSDNFCYHNPHYDTPGGFHPWARNTLALHLKDKREYIYSLKQLESAQTHDDLWNAAQRDMVQLGKMHGYMRMYWAKKILEWTESPGDAMKFAIYLNDRYELDGRDPNGYTGIAWSIGGIHDRPWIERPVFGMVRYMNYDGMRRKFDVYKYIRNNLSGS